MVEEDPNVLKHTTGDDDKLSPLHVAAANSQTPLMYAAKQGKTDCVEKLINAGANIFMLDSRHGGTCLYDAAFHGRIDCLEAILFAAHFTPFEDSRGCARYVNSRDFNGYTPQHLVALQGQSKCVGALLDNAALIGARTGSCGGTPLHMAALGGSLDCIRILLARGADRLQLDFKVHRYQNTPYTVALEHQHKECAALLGPSSAPLVWPYQLKFISELDQEAKALVEVNMPPSSLHSESNNDNIASKFVHFAVVTFFSYGLLRLINKSSESREK
ncbi:E3 ubiquitin-protein ligase XB3 [Glycine soja]